MSGNPDCSIPLTNYTGNDTACKFIWIQSKNNF